MSCESCIRHSISNLVLFSFIDFSAIQVTNNFKIKGELLNTPILGGSFDVSPNKILQQKIHVTHKGFSL